MFDSAKVGFVYAINLHMEIFLIRFADDAFNLFTISGRREYFNVLPEREDKGFQFVVGDNVDFDNSVVEVHNALGLVECLCQHIREAVFRELEVDGLFFAREHADTHYIV